MPPIIRMIAQAHLDPVWLWRWTEGRAEALATSRSAVDRLREYPQLHFTRGEAQVYEWIEEEAPELFAEIRALIREGRWHVVNGMIVQPDMNLPQGESFVRQALLGKGYFQERLGVDVRIAYCVDSFGHAGTLPQILNKCGYDYYVFMRPQEHEKALPPQAFWWQSPDGSRVLAYRIGGTYAETGPEVAPLVERSLRDLPPYLPEAMCFFGVGNHGGGPTKVQVENVLRLAQERCGEAEIRFDHPQAYFDAIAPQAAVLPIVADELQYHATGCYSANSALKRAHRQAECALLLAERMECLAEVWAGKKPAHETLHALWHDLCFNQFHDTLAGSCIKEAEDEAIMALGRVTLSAREMADTAARRIGALVDTAGPGSTVLLFNPFPYDWHGYVDYEPWTDGERMASGWGLVDEAGRPVPYQVLEPASAAGTAARGIDRLLWHAELPPLGYRLYRFGRGLPGALAEGRAQATACSLENEQLALCLDPENGTIVSCLLKAAGVELVGPGGWNVAQVLEDTSDTWSHKVRSFDKVIGCFGAARITVGEQGPLQASLYVERSYEGATWLQQLVVRAGEPEVLVRNWLHWQGRWKMVKLAFDVAVADPQACRDVPFGALPLPLDGAEMPMQMWAGVSGAALTPIPSRAAGERECGLAVLNDGKYACDATGSTLRLTILRCPPYAYHIPHPIGLKARYDWVDQGLQEFTLALRPHAGDWRGAGVVRRARELNLGVLPVTMYAHPGRLPAAQSCARLEGDELELTALKPAEDGRGYILRIADRHGYGGVGTLHWQGQAYSIACKAFEVVTLRLVQEGGRWRAYPCDMIERDGSGD
ncbi:MAG: alpha-mannosidase [Anaerolineae bacterium]